MSTLTQIPGAFPNLPQVQFNSPERQAVLYSARNEASLVSAEAKQTSFNCPNPACFKTYSSSQGMENHFIQKCISPLSESLLADHLRLNNRVYCKPCSKFWSVSNKKKCGCTHFFQCIPAPVFMQRSDIAHPPVRAPSQQASNYATPLNSPQQLRVVHVRQPDVEPDTPQPPEPDAPPLPEAPVFELSVDAVLTALHANVSTIRNIPKAARQDVVDLLIKVIGLVEANCDELDEHARFVKFAKFILLKEPSCCGSSGSTSGCRT